MSLYYGPGLVYRYPSKLDPSETFADADAARAHDRKIATRRIDANWNSDGAVLPAGLKEREDLLAAFRWCVDDLEQRVFEAAPAIGES